ncbi:hypothetical protein [Consotaella salsifontis]|uniref:Uncharacterized protein n=1 Tax=Consotaella salsifontis TaxID=1365950 RepID=A0A1T4PS03_9HYPH|nr:hypothetical protein [Consotaella salsifontis]SJZ94081.1 hypothetical protein SAMN05428963_104117 [Consotaella salsifontis]
MGAARIVVIIAMAVGVGGCTTTEEANQAIQSRWIGQSSDSFFAQYGPPVSQFSLNNGGIIYTWQGGDTQRTIPAQYRTMTKEEKKAQAKYGPRTVINIGGGAGYNSAPPGQVLVSPERTEQLGCEAQITTDAKGIITNVKATRDTDGAGFSFSRCAEVFGVE